MSTQPNFLQALFGQLKQGLPGLAGNLSNTFNQESIYNRLGMPGVQANQQAQQQQAQLAQQLGFHQDEMAQHQVDRGSLSAEQQAMIGQHQNDQQSSQSKDLISMLAGGATVSPQQSLGAVQFNDKWITPPPTHTIGKDSPLGKTIGLESDMTNVPHGEYLKYTTQFGEKQVAAQAKAELQAEKLDNANRVEQMAQGLHTDIDQRFAPQHYEYIYGKGNVDQEAPALAARFHKALNIAAAEDKARNTTTAVQSVVNHFNAYHSDWENARIDERKKNEQLANALNVKTAGQDYSRQIAAQKLYEPAMDAAERFGIMTKNLEDGKKGDQQAMLSMLTNHIGMTLGAQKGSRITQTILDEAANSLPWIQGVQKKFSSDGVLSGVTLSPEQMDQMVALGQERYKEELKKSHANAAYIGVGDGGPQRRISDSTIRYYRKQAGGDINRAKALAARDGWSLE